MYHEYFTNANVHYVIKQQEIRLRCKNLQFFHSGASNETNSAQAEPTAIETLCASSQP